MPHGQRQQLVLVAVCVCQKQLGPGGRGQIGGKTAKRPVVGGPSPRFDERANVLNVLGNGRHSAKQCDEGVNSSPLKGDETVRLDLGVGVDHGQHFIRLQRQIVQPSLSSRGGL